VIVIGLDLTAAPALAGIAALAVVAVVAVWLIPKRQVRRWARAGIRGKELAELENGARTTIVQIVGGVALILTFAATWTQIADTRKATNKSLRLNQAQQETDRFTRAVQELGSNNFALRLGGIYSLDQLARTASDEREPVVELMLAYLHRNHPVRPGVGNRWYGQACYTTKWRAQADTQAALDAILQLTPDAAQLDLSRLDLRAVKIEGRNLAGSDLRRSSLNYVKAAHANLDRARLFQANLRGACFEHASFLGVQGLDETDKTGADFSGATGMSSR
jgi:Pentapeptide repeats (8 copies)